MDLLFAALALGLALLAILRPVVIVRWAQRAHPDLSEQNSQALWTTRFIGVSGLGVAIFYLLIIIRSFSR